MEKEEILKMAQASKNDEYINKVEHDSKLYGMTVVYIFCGIMVCYFYWIDSNRITVQMFQRDIPVGILFTFPCLLSGSVDNLYRYIKLKKKRNLVYGSLWMFLVLVILLKMMIG